jgi:hypothetical protein
MDVKIPDQGADSAGISFYGEITGGPIIIDVVKAWTFDEE